PQREPLVGEPERSRRETVRTADEEAEVLRVDPPLRKPAGPVPGAQGAATALERDHMRTRRNPSLDVDLVADLDHVHRLVSLQELAVVRVGFAEGSLDLSDRDQRDLHGRSPCSQATAAPIRSMAGGWVPNRKVKASGGSGSERFRSASCCCSSINPLGSSVS